MLKVKICGITNLQDALLAVKLGADALGFIFAPSPRRVDAEVAKRIISALPPFVFSVGVFVNEEPSKVREIADYCGLDALQFHGEESPDYCAMFKQRVIKAIKVRDERDIEDAKEYKVSAILFDSPWRGKPFDWRLLKDFKSEIPFILAGGLNPQNISSALEVVHPYGVDASSGLEKHPGKKDEEKLRKFMEVINSWRLKRVTSANSEEGSFPRP